MEGTACPSPSDCIGKWGATDNIWKNIWKNIRVGGWHKYTPAPSPRGPFMAGDVMPATPHPATWMFSIIRALSKASVSHLSLRSAWNGTVPPCPRALWKSDHVPTCTRRQPHICPICRKVPTSLNFTSLNALPQCI